MALYHFGYVNSLTMSEYDKSASEQGEAQVQKRTWLGKRPSNEKHTRLGKRSSTEKRMKLGKRPSAAQSKMRRSAPYSVCAGA
jgi:hypothetical protein